MTETPATATSAELLQAAAENIRMAMHVDPPASSAAVYDTIGALHDITAKLDQHFERVGHALNKASDDPSLRYSPTEQAPDQTDEQIALAVRSTAFRVQMVAGEKLRGLVRELNIAWSETGYLVFNLDGDVEEPRVEVTQDRGAMPRASVPAEQQLRQNVHPAEDVD